jgi:AKAP7 2'5' RNA ligase-like domain
MRAPNPGPASSAPFFFRVALSAFRNLGIASGPLTRGVASRLPAHASSMVTSSGKHLPHENGAKRRNRGRQKAMSIRGPMPTHFISLPLGHHEELQRRAKTLTDSWLALEPAVAGLDRTIVIPPRRLHLTLGVMALLRGHEESPRTYQSIKIDPNPAGSEAEGRAPELPTLERAQQVLDSCIPDINEILKSNGGSPLRLTLDQLGTFQPNREQCHVLFAEPRDADDTRPGLLRAIGGKRFLSSLVPRLPARAQRIDP